MDRADSESIPKIWSFLFEHTHPRNLDGDLKKVILAGRRNVSRSSIDILDTQAEHFSAECIFVYSEFFGRDNLFPPVSFKCLLDGASLDFL